MYIVFEYMYIIHNPMYIVSMSKNYIVYMYYGLQLLHSCGMYVYTSFNNKSYCSQLTANCFIDEL